jgi:type IV pilus assembly protein PilC
MDRYLYKAWDENFNVITDLIEEEDIEVAKDKIRSKGLKIIDIKKKTRLSDIKIGKENLSDETLANFCGQTGIIISSGVSIIRGLELLVQQTKNKKFKGIVNNVLTGVKRGKPLGKSMEDTKAFPRLLTDMILSGELSGNLDTILFNMEQFYQREAAIKNKIKSASIYPVVLLFTGIGMLTFFNFFIFPEMKDLFTDMSQMPAITRGLLNSIEFLNSNFPLVMGVIGALIVGVKYISEFDKVKLKLDFIGLKLPGIGAVKHEIITSRFTRSMGIFLRSAVPILDILDSMQQIVGNKYMSARIELVKHDLINGSSIADAMEQQKIFEPLVTQMIRVGEETGSLEDTMFKLADIYDKRVEAGITKMMAMVEPAFTLIIGILLGIVIIAMAMPVMNMTNGLQ